MAKQKGLTAIPIPVARLLDANLNRAREGLRVLEDTARFIWEHDSLYRRFRSIRHELDRLSRSVLPALVKARSSDTDSGRTVKEGRRRSLEAVVVSNMRRAQEATRVLEEYSRVFSSQAGRRFKVIRYRLYVEEQKIFKTILS